MYILESSNYTYGYIGIGLSLPMPDISASQPLVVCYNIEIDWLSRPGIRPSLITFGLGTYPAAIQLQ